MTYKPKMGRGLATLLLIAFAPVAASCGGKRSPGTANAFHLKRGVGKAAVLKAAGEPDRFTRNCWIYFRKVKGQKTRTRFCFRHGHAYYIRMVVYK